MTVSMVGDYRGEKEGWLRRGNARDRERRPKAGRGGNFSVLLKQ